MIHSFNKKWNGISLEKISLDFAPKILHLFVFFDEQVHSLTKKIFKTISIYEQFFSIIIPINASRLKMWSLTLWPSWNGNWGYLAKNNSRWNFTNWQIIIFCFSKMEKKRKEKSVFEFSSHHILMQKILHVKKSPDSMISFH